MRQRFLYLGLALPLVLATVLVTAPFASQTASKIAAEAVPSKHTKSLLLPKHSTTVC